MLTGKRPLGFTFPVNTSARPLPPSSPGGNTCRTALALCTTEASVWTRPLSTTTTSGVPVSATASTSSCCTPVRSQDAATTGDHDYSHIGVACHLHCLCKTRPVVAQHLAAFAISHPSILPLT